MPLSLTIRRLLSNQPIDLPVFHPIAVRLQQLLQRPDFSMAQVVALANEDQSLAGQILKMANSTAYIGRVRTETIKDAVIRLGARQVANLAMAASQAGLKSAGRSRKSMMPDRFTGFYIIVSCERSTPASNSYGR